MRGLVFFALALVASASATLVNVQGGQGGYHATVGIPTATRILEYEEKLIAKTSLGDRIAGGAYAPVDAHPYFAGLLISLLGGSGSSVCGSSLLTANRLVTAAHCWNDGFKQAWQFTAILGSNYLLFGGTRIATTTVIMHPQYSPSNLYNDIAMIYLPTKVLFTNSIQPVSIPSASELWNTFVGNWAVAIGFGGTSDQQVLSSVVSHVNMQVISVTQCQAVFGSTFVVSSTICTNGAGGVGICGGDSGGPLVLNYNGRDILIGISSFGYYYSCEGGHPSAFARVTSFYSFITQHL